MTTTAVEQLSKVRRALGVFLVPGQACELRALEVGGRRAVSLVSADPDALAAEAVRLDGLGARGVYFTPNPLRPDLAGAKASARKADVSRRHWLLVDVDPVRPADTSSTDAERQAAWDVLDRCRGTLDNSGMVKSVVGDSGNGWHLCYPIDLPNDDESQELVKAVLAGLQKRCGDERAQVDTKCFDAPRIWKLYGTTARKGEPSGERPHRVTWLVEGEPWDGEAAGRNSALLSRLLTLWQAIDDARKGRPVGDVISRAKAYIAKEPPAISGRKGHDRTYHVAIKLVEGFGLSREQAFEILHEWNKTCQPPWSEKELWHKIDSALQKIDPAKLGEMLRGSNGNGHLNGTNGHTNGHARANADTSNDPLDADATAADLIEASCTIRWGWEKWLPVGVLSVLASEPGCGKTRFCADLARRVYLGLPWPDGALPTFEKGARTLWVPADNQHAELGTMPTAFGFPPESLFLNATRRNPFAGTLLDAEEELKEFEARIRRVKPAIVFVDTALNATDRSSHKPEDAKAFFVPLQQIAAKTGVVMVCVTHLNAAGKPLGRRIMGQARVVMQLEAPDLDGQPNRRKLYVVKSNSLFPPALGVTMSDGGNEYDDKPPEAASEHSSQAPNPRLQAAIAWLSERIKGGPLRIGETLKAAEAAGFDKKLTYRAKDSLGFDTFEAQGGKWWKVAGEIIDDFE